MRNQGFTLIELMVVMMILALMGAFMAPNIPVWAASIRMNTSAREIASKLQLARMQAIAQNTEFRVCFYAARPPEFANDFFSTQANAAGGCDTPPAQGDADFVSFKNTVTVLPPNITFAKLPKNLRFRPRGSAVGGTILLENAFHGKRTEIVVALTGRVNVIKN